NLLISESSNLLDNGVGNEKIHLVTRSQDKRQHVRDDAFLLGAHEQTYHSGMSDAEPSGNESSNSLVDEQLSLIITRAHDGLRFASLEFRLQRFDGSHV